VIATVKLVPQIAVTSLLTAFSHVLSGESSHLAEHQQRCPRALTVVSEETALRPQVTDKFFLWPEMRNKRARKSRVALRPVPDGDDKQLPVEGSQSMAKRVSKPQTNIWDLLHLISNNVVAPTYFVVQN
jgi:hypothetical protein